MSAEPDPPTAIRDPLSEHIADSLSGLDVPELRAAARIADIGSGAGFPGLPLAVALPAAQVDLVESARRKCQVIDRLAAGAGIENVRSVAARAEEWGGGQGKDAYEAVTVRALAPLAVLLEYAAPLLQPSGTLVAWKGARDAVEEARAETAAAELGMAPARVVKVEPFEGARHRHLHVFTKEGPTPRRFPRRPGIARKRPLG